MTGMDILEFRDINQPPPEVKIIGDEENEPGGEDSSPPLALIGLSNKYLHELNLVNKDEYKLLRRSNYLRKDFQRSYKHHTMSPYPRGIIRVSLAEREDYSVGHIIKLFFWSFNYE